MNYCLHDRVHNAYNLYILRVNAYITRLRYGETAKQLQVYVKKTLSGPPACRLDNLTMSKRQEIMRYGTYREAKGPNSKHPLDDNPLANRHGLAQLRTGLNNLRHYTNDKASELNYLTFGMLWDSDHMFFCFTTQVDGNVYVFVLFLVYIVCIASSTHCVMYTHRTTNEMMHSSP